jgi:hypothetical protein
LGYVKIVKKKENNFPSQGHKAEGRGQKAEIRRRKPDDRRRKKNGLLLWERLFRPPRLSESDGGQAAAIFTI